MKKLLIAMAALMTLGFVGCEKEEETATDALTGTTWESSYGGTPLAVSFVAGGVVTLNMGSETYTGTYTYNAPNVSIQMSIDGRNVTFTGTYSNGTLNISSSEYGSFIFTQTGGPSPEESGDDGESDGSIQGPAAGVKLVKQILLTGTGEYKFEDNTTYTFEYDNQNRIVKITEEYEDEENKDVHFIYYAYEGNRIYISTGSQSDYLILNDEGNIQTGFSNYGEKYIYENGYLVGMTRLPKKSNTYTWNNGNLVKSYIKDADGSEEIEITYDESVTLVPMNVNIMPILGIVPVLYEDWTYQAVELFDIWGKQSKSPIKKAVYKYDLSEYSDELSLEFSYEYYDDGSVARISATDNNGYQAAAKFAYL